MPEHIQQSIDGLRGLANAAFVAWNLTGAREPLKRCNRLYAQARHLRETFERMRQNPFTIELPRRFNVKEYQRENSQLEANRFAMYQPQARA